MAYIKRGLAAVLCLLLVLMLLPASAFAEEIAIISVEETEQETDEDLIAVVPESKAASTEVLRSYTDSYVNPLYPELEVAAQSDPAVVTASVQSSAEYISCEGTDGLAALLKQSMLKREGTLYFLMHSDTQVDLKVKSLVELACVHSGAPKEGDYLFLHYGSGNLSCSELPAGTGYDYEGQIRLTYLTTAQQEKQVDNAVSALIDDLALGDLDETQKALTVYSWVCENVTVDSEHDSSYTLQHSAYAALINGTASYKGFSALLYRLLLTAGLNSRVIFGRYGGLDHAWNIVKLGNLYYYLDSTLDRGRDNYSYCLKGTNDFTGHVLNSEYQTIAFKRAYPMSETGVTLSNYQPSITTQPKSVAAYEGDTAVFSLKASGFSLKYQWQYRTSDSGSWKNCSVSSAVKAEMKQKASSSHNGLQFRCKVSNPAGSCTSKTVSLTVMGLVKPSIQTQPQDATAAAGETVSYTVKAVGGSLSYQWQYKSPSGSSWNDSTLSGAKTATLKVTATTARDGYQYRCKVTNAAGTTYSDGAKLTLKPSITTQPKSVTAVVGDRVSFTVKASGSNLSYQWQYRKSSTDSWKNCSVSSAVKAEMKQTASSAKNGYQFRCKVSNTVGSLYSDVVTMTVIPKTEITSQPTSVTTEEGKTAKFTVNANGSILIYQWQYKTASGSTWKDSTLSSANTATLKVTATTSRNGMQYRCVVTGDGGSLTSNVVTLTVKPKTEITTQPSNVTAEVGATAIFSLKAGGSDLSYQWQYRKSSTDSWKDCSVSSAVKAEMKQTASSAKNGYQFRCHVTSPTGSVYSNVVTLTVIGSNQTDSRIVDAIWIRG